MKARTGRILRTNEVTFDGSVSYDANANANDPNAAPQTHHGVKCTPQAHIVEKKPDHAVVEVTCSCGTKIHLRCMYS